MHKLFLCNLWPYSAVDRLPSPASSFALDKDGVFRGRIVDSWFDEHRGVVCLVQVMAGTYNRTLRTGNISFRALSPVERCLGCYLSERFFQDSEPDP